MTSVVARPKTTTSGATTSNSRSRSVSLAARCKDNDDTFQDKGNDHAKNNHHRQAISKNGQARGGSHETQWSLTQA